MERDAVGALLFGEAETSDKAQQIAKRYRNCPYVNFMATNEDRVFTVFVLPKRQRWWIEYVEKKPRETLGLERAKVTLADQVQSPEQLKTRLPEKPQDISPCGTNCGACPSYEKCLGCPATRFYKH